MGAWGSVPQVWVHTYGCLRKCVKSVWVPEAVCHKNECMRMNAWGSVSQVWVHTYGRLRKRVKSVWAPEEVCYKSQVRVHTYGRLRQCATSMSSYVWVPEEGIGYRRVNKDALSHAQTAASAYGIQRISVSTSVRCTALNFPDRARTWFLIHVLSILGKEKVPPIVVLQPVWDGNGTAWLPAPGL